MVGALSGLIIFSPIIAVTALTFRITMGSPILLWRASQGLDGRPSTGSNFRTMAKVHDAVDQPLSNERRAALNGHMSRATSLELLTELWNVLVGHMSLPSLRLLSTAYIDRYSADKARSHDVKAGVTSWTPTMYFRGPTNSISKFGMSTSGRLGLTCAFCS